MQKAIGYTRVSTQGQVDDGVSLASQRTKIEAWCLANDYELMAIQEDAGISGTRADRDGLQDALAGLSKGMALVVYSLSRLTRSTKAMLALSEQLDKKGVDLVSLTEKIDTTSASGKMVFRLLAVLNEFERDQISERTKAALSYKKAMGEKYSPLPYGYSELEGRLIAVEAEAKVVAQILMMREEGRTLAFIADHLNQQGIAGKRGGKWYPSTVTYLIQRQAA